MAAFLQGFFIASSPWVQLLSGLALTIFGLIIAPFMLSIMMAGIKWLSPLSYDAGWELTMWNYTQTLAAIMCSYVIVLGVGRLAAFSFILAGFIDDPWK